MERQRPATRPLRLGLLVLTVLLALLDGRPREAAACSCVFVSAGRYLEEADLVFLGRAGKKTVRGDLTVQPFAILHLIKGQAKTFERALKTGVIPPCHMEYAPGDVAVIFAHKGSVDLCSGNFNLEAQLPHLGTYLSHREGKPAAIRGLHVPVHGATSAIGGSSPEAAALEAALRAALGRFLHDRPVVEVGYFPRAGSTLNVGKTRLPVVKKEVGKKGVRISRALVAGAVRLVTGRYDAEGVSFDVLLLATGEKDHPTFEVIKSFARER
jgi:hypothetical protein